MRHAHASGRTRISLAVGVKDFAQATGAFRLLCLVGHCPHETGDWAVASSLLTVLLISHHPALLTIARDISHLVSLREATSTNNVVLGLRDSSRSRSLINSETYIERKMALRAVGPHTCVVCASRLLFSFGNYPRKGLYYEIGEHGQKVYLFNLLYEEAVAHAMRDCHFMKWLVTIPSASSSCQLRAALSEVGVTQVYFEWVNEAEETVLEGVEALTLCAAKMLVQCLICWLFYESSAKKCPEMPRPLKSCQGRQICIRHPKKRWF